VNSLKSEFDALINKKTAEIESSTKETVDSFEAKIAEVNSRNQEFIQEQERNVKEIQELKSAIEQLTIEKDDIFNQNQKVKIEQNETLNNAQNQITQLNTVQESQLNDYKLEQAKNEQIISELKSNIKQLEITQQEEQIQVEEKFNEKTLQAQELKEV
jgi:hypothetical protein